MGKKIESIQGMHSLGLPVPKCVFVMHDDNLQDKIEEYFTIPSPLDLYTIRTDRNDTSMSLKRKLTATRPELIQLANEWHGDYQLILQEFIDERNEIKSGNMLLNNGSIIIEGALDKHINFTNGKSLHLNLSVPRFDSYDIQLHKFFKNQTCFSLSEIFRLIRLAHKIPYTNAIAEFSFFNTGALFFWEVKNIKRCKL